MYRIIDERASGKTSRLMLLAKENNAAFICSNPSAMRAKAHAYGITGLEFMSYDDMLQDEDCPGRDYVVDELENFVKFLCDASSAKMVGYTLSNED